MKKSIEELLKSAQKVLGENTSDDAISLLEDITDTIKPPEIDWEKKYNDDKAEWEQKYNENDKMWREKYRDRFYADVPAPKDEFPKEPEVVVKTKFEELFEEV